MELENQVKDGTWQLNEDNQIPATGFDGFTIQTVERFTNLSLQEW